MSQQTETAYAPLRMEHSGLKTHISIAGTKRALCGLNREWFWWVEGSPFANIQSELLDATPDEVCSVCKARYHATAGTPVRRKKRNPSERPEILNRRIKLDLSQESVAKALRISARTIRRAERGKCKPATLDLLSAYYEKVVSDRSPLLPL